MNTRILLVLFVAAGGGAASCRVDSSRDPPQALAAQGGLSALISDGRRIFVPQGSSLRGTLPIAVVAGQPHRRKLEVPGTVEPVPTRTAAIFSPVAGRVGDFKVEVGDRISQQQEIAVIISDGLVRTPIEIEKRRRPLSAFAVPIDTMEDARQLSLKSPVAGTVIGLRIEPGLFVDRSSEIMTIADLEMVWVVMNIPKKNWALLEAGESGEIIFTAYPGEFFSGEPRFVDEGADPDALGAQARIALENPGIRLKPNMSAIVTLFGPSQTALTIPVSALMQKNRTSYVFVEVAPWRFEARPA